MTQPRSIVYVVDDDDSVRRGLKRLLKSSGLDVRTFASAAEFLNGERLERPGCLVLDLKMPGLSGIDLQESMAGAGIEMPIVFITGHGDIPTSVQAMKAGAVDFLTKPFKDQVLLEAIRQAIDRDVRGREDRSAREEFQADYNALTPREREVFAHLITGRLNKQIAAELGTTEKTIKVHRARVLKKMGVTSLAELARLAEKYWEGSGSHHSPSDQPLS